MTLINEYISHQGLKPSPLRTKMVFSPQNQTYRSRAEESDEFSSSFANVFESPDRHPFLSPDVRVGVSLGVR